ncbi:hypothetical protein AX774_g2573 [Zancudomyces culisetae]|uniref:Sister chromatid cohesion protein n=1 Tax=Zancudomyces culisetae TaxID=1213189 RepID=A0A1R1PSK8_ZANCU|nr:hypothetical protein AX774_g2573 [Zancudomyces culisetae]|eukprot:OMH83909.1 hypothetical protein AX774_g2573 [Zancudomyces culisetae]
MMVGDSRPSTIIRLIILTSLLVKNFEDIDEQQVVNIAPSLPQPPPEPEKSSCGERNDADNTKTSNNSVKKMGNERGIGIELVYLLGGFVSKLPQPTCSSSEGDGIVGIKMASLQMIGELQLNHPQLIMMDPIVRSCVYEEILCKPDLVGNDVDTRDESSIDNFVKLKIVVLKNITKILRHYDNKLQQLQSQEQNESTARLKQLKSKTRMGESQSSDRNRNNNNNNNNNSGGGGDVNCDGNTVSAKVLVGKDDVSNNIVASCASLVQTYLDNIIMDIQRYHTITSMSGTAMGIVAAGLFFIREVIQQGLVHPLRCTCVLLAIYSYCQGLGSSDPSSLKIAKLAKVVYYELATKYESFIHSNDSSAVLYVYEFLLPYSPVSSISQYLNATKSGNERSCRVGRVKLVKGYYYNRESNLFESLLQPLLSTLINSNSNNNSGNSGGGGVNSVQDSSSRSSNPYAPARNSQRQSIGGYGGNSHDLDTNQLVYGFIKMLLFNHCHPLLLPSLEPTTYNDEDGDEDENESEPKDDFENIGIYDEYYNKVQFIRFICENMLFFKYSNLDQVLFTISMLTKLVVDFGYPILAKFETASTFKLQKTSSNEHKNKNKNNYLDSNLQQMVADNNDLGEAIDCHDIFCSVCVGIFLLTRETLKSVYKIPENKCAQLSSLNTFDYGSGGGSAWASGVFGSSIPNYNSSFVNIHSLIRYNSNFNSAGGKTNYSDDESDENSHENSNKNENTVKDDKDKNNCRYYLGWNDLWPFAIAPIVNNADGTKQRSLFIQLFSDLSLFLYN